MPRKAKAKGKVHLSPKAKASPLDLAIESKETAFLPKPKLEAPHTHLLCVVSVTKLDTSQKIAEGESSCTATPCTNKLGANLVVGNNYYLMILNENSVFPHDAFLMTQLNPRQLHMLYMWNGLG
jgi:hypothetical protein